MERTLTAGGFAPAFALTVVALVSAPVMAVPPPPVPPGYDMGVVANGDFEAGGGSLDDWSGGSSVGYLVEASYGTVSLSGDTVMKLHANADIGGGYPSSERAEAWCLQEIDVPATATVLTFVYYASYDWQRGNASMSLECTGAGIYENLSSTYDWVAVSKTIPQSMKGQRATLRFEVEAEYYEFMGGSTTLYVDYVSLIPEPATMSLLGVGLAALAVRRKRRVEPQLSAAGPDAPPEMRRRR